MPQTGIIILCHGSRGDNAVTDLPARMQSVVDNIISLYNTRKVAVAWAALQFNHPTLEESAERLITTDTEKVVIVPYFLFSGRHIDEDIPEIIKALKGRYPHVDFILTKTIGEDELFLPIIIDRIRETPAGKELAIFAPDAPPESIERQSMEIIEKFLSSGEEYSAEEKAVVKRIIHASGDPQVVRLIHFGPEAISAGIEAVKKGCSIFTDVRMVAVGINAKAASACGCTITCAIEETADDDSSTPRNNTRAAAAIRSLGQRLDDAIIAIGNAPTALLALVKLINNDNVKPALIIGIPVGFVQAAESKEALMQSKVPYLTVIGTRGGSAMATAAVNALLKLVNEKQA